MLSALLPVYAARAGEPALARSCSRRGYGDFINEPFLEPDEYPRSRTDRPRASPMFANLSGYLTGVLYGFTGLQLGPWQSRDLVRTPVSRCRRAGAAIHVERIWVRGGPASLDRSGQFGVGTDRPASRTPDRRFEDPRDRRETRPPAQLEPRGRTSPRSPWPLVTVRRPRGPAGGGQRLVLG